MHLGPIKLLEVLGTLGTLGTNFKIPLGTKYFLILQNLIEWHLFMQ